MNLTSPSEVRRTLASLGVHPTRRLGQNFLVDLNILNILVAAADLSARDAVLEIGPGLGVVTERLCAAARRVVAVEKDARLAAFLRERFAGSRSLQVVHGDALDEDLEARVRSGLGKVVSNLPYASGSRILAELSHVDPPPERIVVTVQQEVADRLRAPPSGRQYGLLSVWLQRCYAVQKPRTVSASCFWPRPEVRSAIVCLSRVAHEPMAPRERAAFRGLTRYAFSQRRKQLATVLGRAPAPLGRRPDETRAFLVACGLDPRARPEDLPAGAWVRLSKHLTSAASKG